MSSVRPSYLNGATALAFAYNTANRRVAVQSSGAPLASYAVNALGQRVTKAVGAATTYFVYDEQGHLLGEYDGTGALIQETVWLEDLPVATLRPTGSGNPTPIAIYYVHADHLGSPRAITRPSDNAMMWQWDNVDPFGANAADENPGGQGTFTVCPEIPGAILRHRDGHALQLLPGLRPGRRDGTSRADPIGLRGGGEHVRVCSKVVRSGVSIRLGLAHSGPGPTPQPVSPPITTGPIFPPGSVMLL